MIFKSRKCIRNPYLLRSFQFVSGSSDRKVKRSFQNDCDTLDCISVPNLKARLAHDRYIKHTEAIIV